MVRREHRADAGHDHVEAVVGERQRLGVALDPVQLDPPLGGDPAADLEQLGRQVRGGDGRAEAAAGMAAFPVPAPTSSTR